MRMANETEVGKVLLPVKAWKYSGLRLATGDFANLPHARKCKLTVQNTSGLRLDARQVLRPLPILHQVARRGHLDTFGLSPL